MRVSVWKELLDILSYNKHLLLTEEGKWLTGRDLKHKAEKLADAIQRMPFGAVGVCCQNNTRFLTVLFAAFLAKRPQVLFGAKWPDREIIHHMNQSPCTVLITDRGSKALFDSFQPVAKIGDLHVLTIHSTVGSCPEGEWIGQYTSGTTGTSRLVIRDWEAIQDEIDALDLMASLPAENTFLTMAPPHHSYGFCGGTIWPLLKRAKLILIRSFYPSYCKNLWNTYRPNVVYGLPFQYEFVANAPGFEHVPRPSYAFSAGGPLTRKVREKTYLKLGIHLSNNYGSTETGTMCVYPEMPIDESERCVGWPLTGRTIQKDDSGQLILDGRGIMRGYYGSSSAPIPYPIGDIGLIREDGCVEVHGRFRPVINIGGVKISPDKVENVLRMHPGVQEAVVMAYPRPAFYHMMKCFVVLQDGWSLSANDLRDYCRRHLMPIEVPSMIEIIDEIPRSDTGKIMGKYLLEKSGGWK